MTSTVSIAAPVLGAALAVSALSACSSNYYLDPSSQDKQIWSEISVEDQMALCSTYWTDEGYKSNPGEFRSMLRDQDFGPGLDRRTAEAITNMVASGVGC